jgi:hypothetical protein
VSANVLEVVSLPIFRSGTAVDPCVTLCSRHVGYEITDDRSVREIVIFEVEIRPGGEVSRVMPEQTTDRLFRRAATEHD